MRRETPTTLALLLSLLLLPALPAWSQGACQSCVREETRHSFRIDGHPVFDGEQQIGDGCGYIEFPAPVFKVSADGTGSSIFDVDRIVEGTCQSTLIEPRPSFMNDFFVLLGENEADPDFYGTLEVLEQDDLAVRFRYTHPTVPPPDGEMFRVVRIAITYFNPANVTLPFRTASWLEIHVYRSPVLMIHGLWSNSDTFRTMQDDFEGDHYEAAQLKRMDYRQTAGSRFAVNAPKVADEVSGLIQQGADEGFAAGMVDLVGHSMGGILARMYVEGSSYAEDVHRVVTANAPHSGSQLADLLLDRSFDPLGLLCGLMTPFGGLHACTDGAIEDLSSQGPAVANDMGGGTHPDDVAVHALATIYDPEDIPIAPVALLHPMQLVYAYIARQCGASLLDDLFNHVEHDLMVSLTSQAGGLQEEPTSVYPDIWHTGSVKQPEVVDQVQSLLADEEDSTRFTTAGYTTSHESYFTPGLCPLGIGGGGGNALAAGPAPAPSLDLTGPGTTLAPGEAFTVDVSGSSDLATLLVVQGQSADALEVTEAAGPSASVGLSVPDEVVGSLSVVVAGFDASGNLVAVSDALDVDVESPAELLAIDVYPPAVYLKPCGEATLAVRGEYDDGITRDLGRLDESVLAMSFASADPGPVETARTGPTSLALLGELEDEVTVSVDGVEAAPVPIRVLAVEDPAVYCPEPGPLCAALAALGALLACRGRAR